jgi:aspartyl-tRNA(Asn)/glutamyl-tRNA(Gln) amidotransferase subunit B
VLTAEKEASEYYERLAAGRDPKLAANWLITNLFAVLNKQGRGIADSPISADDLGALLDLMSANRISGRQAKEVFEVMAETGAKPAAIVAERGLSQITDEAAIEAAVDAAIAANPAQVEQYRSGNDKVLGWLVGQIMKSTKGKANPPQVNALLRKKLSD